VLRLSRRSEYGVIAAIDLVLHNAQAVSAREIAERYRIPKRILAEVMKDLAHRGIVRSTRGVAGGYRLAIDPSTTSIGALLSALEGPFEMVPCTSERASGGPERPGEALCDLLSSCPIRGTLHRIYERIHEFLEGVTLEEAAHTPALTTLTGSPAPAAAAASAGAGAPRVPRPRESGLRRSPDNGQRAGGGGSRGGDPV
jgi:Rrf2 family protein